MKETTVHHDFSEPVIKSTSIKNTKHLSRVLHQATLSRNRVSFDPTNVDHRVAYLVFRDTGKWTMNFYSEKPSTSIVATVERKIIEDSLKDVLHLARPITEKILRERTDKPIKLIENEDPS